MLIVLLGWSTAVGAWSKAPQLPHPRSAHAVVVEHNSIYVLGGPSTAVVDRFDGKHWRRETTLPGGKLNAPGGGRARREDLRHRRFLGLDERARLAAFASTTRARAAGPRPRRCRPLEAATRRSCWTERSTSSAVGNSESTIADHSVYDPATDSWSEAAPLPRAEGSPAAVTFQGKLYAIGGRSGTTDYGDVFVYDAGVRHMVDRPGDSATRDGGSRCLPRLDLRLRR